MLEMTVGCSHSGGVTLGQSTVPAGRVTMTLLSQGSGWSMVPENQMEGFGGGLTSFKGFWPSQDPPNNWDESPVGLV